MTSVIDSKRLKAYLKIFRQHEGFVVEYDNKIGTCKVTDVDGVACLQALKKSKDHWITTYKKSVHCQWSSFNECIQ